MCSRKGWKKMFVSLAQSGGVDATRAIDAFISPRSTASKRVTCQEVAVPDFYREDLAWGCLEK